MNYTVRNKWWMVAFAVLVALNIATLSAFWLLKVHAPQTFLPAPPGVDFLAKELGLDEKQKQLFDQLRNRHQLAVRDVRERSHDAKDAFFSLLKVPGTSDSAISQAARNAATYEAELDLLTFRHFQQIRDNCTSSQKKKFDSIIQQVLRMNARPDMPGLPTHGVPPPGEGPHLPPPR